MDDAAELTPLTDDSLLQLLQDRYNRSQIYTWAGEALISVNPCRPLALYSPRRVREYLRRAAAAPPHLYAVAAAAFRAARDRRREEFILITGESGSGKSEAWRICLQALVVASGESCGGGGGGGGGADAGVGATLVAASTLLEAFGHASTPLNHNASRFGKLADIEVDFKGELVGAHITHYLLETERWAFRGPGERNFHVLYQLLAGADAATLKRLKLQRSWRSYRVLEVQESGGGGGGGGGGEEEDAAQWAHTQAAAAALRVDWAGVLRVLAFLLKLGDVRVQPEQRVDGSLGAVAARAGLRDACAGVGVAAAALAAALGGALEQRDRLLRAVYARLVGWLVRAANERLAGAGGGGAVALLDMYGLEALRHNALDRLLINLAAERVHAAAARLPRRQRDPLAPDRPDRPDRPDCPDRPDTEPSLEMVERVIDALQEVSAGGGGGAELAARVAASRGPSPRASPARAAPAAPAAPARFRVLHFAGAVTYHAADMPAHNRDMVCSRVSSVLRAASDPLLSWLFSCDGDGGGGGGAGADRAGRQRALLAALERRVPRHTRAVRCLRAHLTPRPTHFHAPLVLRQLSTHRLRECAAAAADCWAEAWGACEFVRRYAALLPRAAPSPRASPRASPAPPAPPALRRLLRALPLPPGQLLPVRDLVLVRSWRTAWRLEELRAARVRVLVVCVQRWWRRGRERRRGRAAAVIARAWRGRRGRQLARARAARVIWRWWASNARRRYLAALWARLPARHASPALAAWPAPPQPALLGHADRLLRALHHRWRCLLYRRSLDQTARNRMREKLTAHLVFAGRKASYAASVGAWFAGDYVRLRHAAGWRRGAGGAGGAPLVFADAAAALRAAGGARPVLLALSTVALVLVSPRSLRARRRVAAWRVARVALSPHADDVVCVHVCGAGSSSDGGGCARSPAHGDVLLRVPRAIEAATKLLLVVQHALGTPPPVTLAPAFPVTLDGELLTVLVHPGATGAARVVRRGDTLHVLP